MVQGQEIEKTDALASFTNDTPASGVSASLSSLVCLRFALLRKFARKLFFKASRLLYHAPPYSHI